MSARTLFVGCAFAAVGVVIGLVSGQDRPATPPTPAGSPDAAAMAEMMKKMEAVMKPGPKHEMLQKFVGDWKTTTKLFMGTNAPMSETTGTSKISSILGGRFLLEEFHGQMLMPGPEGEMVSHPFDGIGISGYDNYRNVFVGCWVDSFNTHILSMTGVASPNGKVITSYGEMDEPVLNMTGRTVKYVTRIVDDNHRVFEIYDLAAGDDYKVIEIHYERR